MKSKGKKSYTPMLIFQKIIDRSTLRQGFQIPVAYHPLLAASPGGLPAHGETRKIKILIDGKEFLAELKNQDFDKTRYPDHADVVQIRYGNEVATFLQKAFSSTWNYVKEQKALPENANKKVTIKIPVEKQEYLALSSSTLPDVFLFDCFTLSEKKEAEELVCKMDELDYETAYIPQFDPHATITEVSRVQRVRKLDRKIGESLKKLYDYRCQMTGERIGEAQNALCVEAHHIDPFTKSMNNDYSNIIILSPSYHRIIHTANPLFDRNNLSFHFPNGLIEKVKLDMHLGK